MADADKNILITPSVGAVSEPTIGFTGFDNNTVTLRVLDDGTLSFEGSAGQLFSISDSLSGTIFSVNDVSGIPSLEVDDNGVVRIAEFSGNVLVGTSVDNGIDKLQVNGDILATTFKGALSGNATTASAWATGRTISLTGAVTGTSASWTGSGNISIATTATADPTITLAGDLTGSVTLTNLGNGTLTATVVNDSHTHDTRYIRDFASGNTGITELGRYIDFHTTGSVADYDIRLDCESATVLNLVGGTLEIGGFRAYADNYHPNADTWTTGRTISLTGAVTGTSAAWNGSGNISIATTATADPTLTLAGDVTGSATFTNLGNATLTATVANDSHSHSNYIVKNTGYTWTATGGNALSFQSLDTMDTATSDQAALEVYQDTAGADAFMQFHVAGDYAKYFGLNGAVNDFGVSGWSGGATFQRMFHDAYHPNADKWTTARTNTVTLTGDATGSGSASVDGTGNWTVSVPVVVNNDSHNHNSSSGDFIVYGKLFVDQINCRTDQDLTITTGESDSVMSETTYNDEIIRLAGEGGVIVYASSDNLTSGLNRQTTLIDTAGDMTVGGDVTATIFNGELNGNASTASTWTTPRTATVTLTGDVTGTAGVSVNGSAGWTNTITTVVGNDSHTHSNSTITGIEASTASTVVQRNGSGDINARLFRSEYDTTNASIGYIMTQVDTATNNYIRPSTPAQLRASVTDGVYAPISHSHDYVPERNRADWNDSTVIDDVIGQLAWKHYGNNHTIFDASNSTNPLGTAENNTNPDVAWAATYPTLMGFNGTSTYGVRVDSSRYADQWKTARTATVTLTGDVTGTVGASVNGSGNWTNSVATQIAANVVNANELNVSGNGTTSQYLRSDGDGTFTWATPPDNNTTYSTNTAFGTTMSGTQIRQNGASIPTGANLNDYRTQGVYAQNSNSNAAAGSNYPESVAGVLTVDDDMYGNGLHTAQTYYIYNNQNVYARSYYNGSWTSWRNLAQDTIYTHPTYNGDDFSIDTGALSGATVISDIDINVTTDTLGHVTDANASVATRTLTAANIGALSTTGKAADSNLLDGIDSASFLRSNVADTKSAGNLTFSDNVKLNIGGQSDLAMYCNGNTQGDIYFDALNTNGSQVIVIRDLLSTPVTRFTFGIPTGDFTATGNVTAYSDIRVKTNLQVIPDAVNKVKQLNGYTYDRIDIDTSRQTGVVAQEVLEVLPEAVTGGPTESDPDGHYSVAYGNMVGLLIEAIKEQQVRIESLENDINKLKNEVR